MDNKNYPIMKKLATFALSVLLGVVCFAQARTNADIDSKTFVVGLDNYIVGETGGLGFNIKSNTFKVDVADGAVSVAKGSQKVVLYDKGLKVPAVNSWKMPVLDGEFVVGVHDFTGDSAQELVIAVKDASGSGIVAFILQYSGGKWISIGEIGAVKGTIKVMRAFRQAMTLKNEKTGALYTWTWHKGGFTFKASDGTKSAANLL